MTKASLRTQYLARRGAMEQGRYVQQSQQVQERFWQAFDLAKYSHVHIYLSVAKRREVDTWGIIHTLFSQYPEVIVAAPQLVGNPEHIVSRIIMPKTSFQAHPWGMQEPQDSQMIAATAFDIVILPVIAFDIQGYRVGYGKGHYDRFLAQCRPTVTQVGLCFEDPISAITDLHAYDMPMDYCITPQQVWSRTSVIC